MYIYYLHLFVFLMVNLSNIIRMYRYIRYIGYSPIHKPTVPSDPIGGSGCFNVSKHVRGCTSEIQPNWLVVSTHLKNISQSGNLPQVGVKINNV